MGCSLAFRVAAFLFTVLTMPRRSTMLRGLPLHFSEGTTSQPVALVPPPECRGFDNLCFRRSIRRSVSMSSRTTGNSNWVPDKDAWSRFRNEPEIVLELIEGGTWTAEGYEKVLGAGVRHEPAHGFANTMSSFPFKVSSLGFWTCWLACAIFDDTSCRSSVVDIR
jgi:hypothetical protein